MIFIKEIVAKRKLEVNKKQQKNENHLSLR